MNIKVINKDFVYKIILPTLFVFSLFTILIFAVIIPSMEKYMLDGKREMIKELTTSAWSVLEELDHEVSEGIISLEEAQKEAIISIESMRYGSENKDYFWITDMQPNMIMHPYRKELNNTDLSYYADAGGKKLFVEFKNIVKNKGEGYSSYMWQWKDDSTRIVPKLSFVKGFEKWNWVIGTGIYIEDVNDEISSITSNLGYSSLGILIILAFILFFINRQSLMIEEKRYQAEIGLKESEAKYRALVEASTEGLVMMLDGKYVYANKTLLIMLGFDDELDVELDKLLFADETRKTTGSEYFKDLSKNRTPLEKLQAKLKKRDKTDIDIILFTSPIKFGDREGYTIIVKDVSVSKKIENELDENKEKYLSLTNSLNIGVFRAVIDNGKFIDANKIASTILGYYESDVYSISFFDLFHNESDKENFIKTLIHDGSISNYIAQIKKTDGSATIVNLSAVIVKDSNNSSKHFDCTIDDITEKIKLDKAREDLIVNLQTSVKFLNQPIDHFLKHTISCNYKTSIKDTAKLMTTDKFSAALIKSEEEEIIGIITDKDLRKRVVAESVDLNNPIYTVMSSPIISISSSSLVFEAFLMMHEHSTRHLAVKNTSNKIVGIISSEELLTVQRHSTSYLIKEIERASHITELITIRKKVPRLVQVLIDSGARSGIISHIISSIFENIAVKLISFAIDELGEPPTEFTFIALGSVGREEQTLISDQDNAIIYEDVPKESEEQVHEYFHKLGIKVCDWLNDCGYDYCMGDAMAKNPKWCQSLSKWKEYFHSWIVNSDQQDLIDLSIFFDFRSIYGKSELSDELRKFLFNKVEGQSGFFLHLTKNSILRKPPVGLLGNIVVESKGEHSDSFDIKAATMPISDFGRIYALKYGISNTNTLERLDELLNKGVINKTTNEELKQSLNYLMQLRLKHQSQLEMENRTADNYINPDRLTQIDQKTLKNVFSQIISIQKKLSYDFSGEAI